MFIDEVILELHAGRGGNGMVAFRREKYVEFGGPSGGNGGNGGSIILVGDSGKNTLYDLKFNHHIKAQAGENGKSKGMHGKNANNTYVHVPLGTQVYSIDNIFIGEVTKNNEELIIAKGGKGGRGNIAFSSHKNPAPDFAENGDLGEELKVRIELKVLADVGIIGYPSVGKSSLISILSNAKPKIDSYPFTTLSPNLGVLSYYDNTLVLADLPGLIKNASSGQGLGFKFLRHIERCKIFIHVIDCLRDDPYQDYLDINQELELYNEQLIKRPQVVVINKIDSIDDNKLKDIKNKFRKLNPIYISVHLHTNIDELIKKIFLTFQLTPDVIEDHIEIKYYTKEKDEIPFEIEEVNGVFYIKGDVIKKYFDRTNIDNYSSVMRFSRVLRGLGVDEALRNMGAKNQSVVNVYGFEFEFIDE
ncbi:GTPase ObgE [Acholeplasma sp. OttesenSCG-928-E16]|nr:GTPase ObgE [Acholeplasma sp. OttesenSCG-928-E16]